MRVFFSEKITILKSVIFPYVPTATIAKYLKNTIPKPENRPKPRHRGLKIQNFEIF